MGYRGKVEQQQQARALRAQNMTLAAIAAELGVRKSSVTDSHMVELSCAWLRRFFVVDESRLRLRVYLHEGLDIETAERHWSEITKIPRSQFRRPHRAAADPTIRRNKHEHGCVYVSYSCSATHREIMGLVRALLSSQAIPG
jgi:hypothetical protein